MFWPAFRLYWRARRVYWHASGTGVTLLLSIDFRIDGCIYLTFCRIHDDRAADSLIADIAYDQAAHKTNTRISRLSTTARRFETRVHRKQITHSGR